jgi:ATP-binding cassette, subfamily B, bacterial
MDSASGFAWPLAELGRAVDLLTRASGLRAPSAAPLPAPPSRTDSRDALAGWTTQVCRRLDVEAEPIDIAYNGVERTLNHAGPAIVMLPGAGGETFLAILAAGKRRAVVLGCDGRRHRVRVSAIAAWLRRDFEAPIAPRVQALVAAAGIPTDRHAAAALAIMRDRFGPAPVSHGWLLRLPPGAPFRHHLRQALVTRHIVIFSIAYMLQTCVSVTAWFMVGRAALEGRFDAGTVFAWTFLLLMLAPLGLVAAWSQGVFAVGAGGLLKLRLLFGALRLEPDETRHQGIGQQLARVIESETVESLALAGGFYALATAVELLMASAIFIAASLVTHLFLLVMTVAMTALLGWRSFERRHQWTGTRLEMTNDVVERMVGHRTRLAQEPSSDWHTDEDRRLDGYVTRSARMDRADLALLAIPRAWLIIAVLGLAPSFLAIQNSSTILAVGLGAILLAYGAFARLTSTFSYAASAVIGWKQFKPLVAAATRPEEIGCVGMTAPALPKAPRSGALLTAHDLAFRFPDRAEPAIEGCSFEIRHGDRIHLSGASGSGKSTLVSLLTGLRTPGSGVLLLDGLDRATLGADLWRQRVVAAPQFHENHVFGGSLAFNVLLGRGWPPRTGDLELAEDVCRRLGLGDLLDRMPGGLFQLVGETGWQLSHGERSRMFIARALLQNADLVVLDESFAELDPESLRDCLAQAAALSNTLLVVAHT